VFIKTKPTTSLLVLVLLSARAWLILIPSCKHRVALLVRPRAAQAEATAAAAASSQQLAAAAAAAAAAAHTSLASFVLAFGG
jgi:hypothetical protein